MESVGLKAMDEEKIFEVDYRTDKLPSRRLVVLRTKMKPKSKEKLANNARFAHRTSRGPQARNSVQR